MIAFIELLIALDGILCCLRIDYIAAKQSHYVSLCILHYLLVFLAVCVIADPFIAGNETI